MLRAPTRAESRGTPRSAGTGSASELLLAEEHGRAAHVLLHLAAFFVVWRAWVDLTSFVVLEVDGRRVAERTSAG